MEKLPGEVTRLSPGNFSPPTFQTGRFPGETDVSPVKLPGEEFGLKGVLHDMGHFGKFNLVSYDHSKSESQGLFIWGHPVYESESMDLQWWNQKHKVVQNWNS